MDTLKKTLILVLLCGLVGACSPNKPEPIKGIDGFRSGGELSTGGVATTGGSSTTGGDTGTGGASDTGGQAEDAEPLAYAVVSGDRTVASISLLKPDGEILAEDFINSGSASAGLVTALSGDVVVPTRSGTPEILTLIDRFRTDVVTRIDPGSGKVLGQVKTHAPNNEDDDMAFSSNPYDYVYFDEETAWITRFEPNVGVDADDPDAGNDLLLLDPTAFRRGERISLWDLNTEAPRTNPDTMATEMVAVYARPSSMVRLGDQLVVGLARLSLSYDAIGPGMVALVSPADGTVEGFELPDLQNCGAVTFVPDDPARVVVSCSGFFRSGQRDTAGIALLHLEAGELSIEHVWRGKDDEDAPLSISGVVSLGGTEIAAMAAGARAVTNSAGNEITPATTDALYLLDLATGKQTELFKAGGRYVIGSGAYNPRRKLLLVPDATVDDDGKPTGGVRLFTRGDAGKFETSGLIKVHSILPPRQVNAL